MNPSVRRGLCLTLVLLLLSSVFAGCSTGGSNSDLSTPSTQGTSPSSDEEVAIEILHYMGEQTKRDALDQIIAVFEEANPGVRVDPQIVDVGQYITIYKTRINANDAPDIFFGAPRDLIEFIEGGHFLDISGAPMLDRVLPEVLDETEYGGKLYGLPIDVQIKGVFYNKEMFQERNLEVPATRDEFLALCEAFDAEGILPLIHAYNFSYAQYQEIDSYMVAMALARGEEDLLTDSQAGIRDLAGNATAREAMEFFARLVSWQDPGDLGMDQPTAIQNFAVGRRPMFINGGWIISDASAANPEAEFGVFPTPWSNNPDENKLCVALDDAFIVSATTNHLNEIYALFDTMMTDECADIWMRETRILSSLKGASAADLGDPFVQMVQEIVSSGDIAAKALLTDYTAEYIDAYTNILQSYCVRNDGDVDALLRELDEEMARIRQ